MPWNGFSSWIPECLGQNESTAQSKEEPQTFHL